MGVADILVDITEPGVEPSIQTAPLAFKPNVEGPAYIEAFTTNLFRVVAHLIDIERRTGRRIKVSLEPEPYCFLETTEETVAYFEEHIYSRAGVEQLAVLADCPVSEAIHLVRRHLGIVFDIGHQSVEFEDIPVALESLVAAGIPIFKLQEAAALWVPEVTDEAVAALEKFTDTIYLSQTTERRDGELTRFLNLGDAIAAWQETPGRSKGVADALPRAGVPRRDRRVPHHPDEHRGGTRHARADTAVGPPRDRDLHVGRAARRAEDGRHHRVRQPRDRVGPRRLERGRVGRHPLSAPLPLPAKEQDMSGRVDGKAIIITGAGSGMGRVFALGLAREGATVGVLDLRLEAAESVCEELAGEGLKAIPLFADVSKREQVTAAFDTFVEQVGRLDVLFNNAGFNVPMHLMDVTEENWRAIMDVNGLGTLIGIQEGARRMIPQRSGKIINTSSIAGRQGFPSFAPYCASKFAVNALTQAAARALAEHNITCNAFAPGVVDTPLWTKLDEDLMDIGDAQEPGQAMADFASGILRGHVASGEDILGTALYLASDDSNYLTGQVIMIDGGMVLV